ncbi:uncharacterized protein EV154DRAFT_291555 [Mucor mucedo]|uniref:uncharacterized protein n=1 Tax=Mucor mucedo TaxID=29922 RepID=UPI00221E7A15|nr:uncharacterized protein EV154DRAFT_291555 [Mucor mucedo]KAI7889101.1 hypothetical protein EV154DRAFT_291555 [Mucor mucedo]
MAFEFLATGQYKIILGKSFDAKPKKKAPKYFNVKNKASSDSHAYGSEAKLEKKKDKYQVEMKHTSGPNIAYEAEVSTEEEYNCILIYNEEKKTITLERQSAQIKLTRKIHTPPPVPPPVSEPPQTNHSAMTNSPLPGNQYTTIHTPPIVPKEQKVVRTPPPPPPQTHTQTHTQTVVATPTVVTPTVVKPTVVTPPVVTTPVVVTPTVQDNSSPAMMMEDDEFDLSKDMDEILDSDGEDSDSEDQFEEIAAPTAASVTPSMPLTPSLHPASPSIPLNLALPSTPTATLVHTTTSSPTPLHAPSPTNVKKRKLASAPIRHPGIISPVMPITKPTHMMVGNKKQKTESSSEEEDSSSGSESGSTDDSSSGESESESGSSSDDDDFESLAQDISMSLDKGGPSAPPSPQHHHSMTGGTPGHTPTPSTRQPSSQGAPAPMSLRALFKEDDEEEGLSSSSSEDE